MFLKVKGFAFGGALTFYSLSAPRSLPPLVSLLSYVYIIHIGPVARKAECDRWLVRRRVPRAHLVHPPTHLPTYERKSPSVLPLRVPLTLIIPGRSFARSPQTTNMLQALKRLFNICRGVRCILRRIRS